MGGTSILLSKSLLYQIGPYLKLCLKNVVTIHEDTEIGRCIINVLNISCSKKFSV